MPNPVLDEVLETVSEVTTVLESSLMFASAVPGWIADAKAEAIENGATAEQLAPFDTLMDELRAKAQTVAAKIVENTPVARLP